MSTGKKIKKRLKRYVKAALNRIGFLIYYPCCSSKSERNVVVLLDTIREPNAPLIDGFALFEYMMSLEICPLKPVYLINEESPKVMELMEKYRGNILPVCKRRRIRTFLLLTKLFRETFAVCQTTMGLQWLTFGADAALKRSKNITNIFTQHGVTYFKDKFITKRMYGSNFFNKVMVSSIVEIPIFEERGGFLPNNIIKNGLFRWDSMLKKTENTVGKVIFIYFTYRYYMGKCEQAEVRESIYIRRVQELLDSDIMKKLTERGYSIKMAVHHSAVATDCLTVPEFVEIVTEDEIASVKKEAAVLVTDCSSMCFEMMKMAKPVVCYDLLDESDCRKHKCKQDLVKVAEKTSYLTSLTKGMAYTSDIDTFSKCIEEVLSREMDDATFEDLFFYKDGFCKRFYRYLIDELWKCDSEHGGV